MSVPVKEIQSGIKDLTRVLIGSRLSTMKTGSGTSPSVVVNRSGTTKLKFPYAIVDHVGLRRYGRDSSAQYFDENEDEVTEFDHILRYSVQVNGGISDDTQSICNELASRLTTSQGMSLIDEHLVGARLLTISSPTFLSALMVTDYEEATRITIDFTVKDLIVDTTTEVIEEVIVNGEVYNDFNTDDTPLSVLITAP